MTLKPQLENLINDNKDMDSGSEKLHMNKKKYKKKKIMNLELNSMNVYG